MSQKISAMPVPNLPLTGAELVPIVQGGLNKQATVQQLIDAAVPARHHLVAGNGVTANAAFEILTIDQGVI